MADIKTGIFAKNVQKRLNRAQEKVSEDAATARKKAKSVRFGILRHWGGSVEVRGEGGGNLAADPSVNAGDSDQHPADPSEKGCTTKPSQKTCSAATALQMLSASIAISGCGCRRASTSGFP